MLKVKFMIFRCEGMERVGNHTLPIWYLVFVGTHRRWNQYMMHSRFAVMSCEIVQTNVHLLIWTMSSIGKWFHLLCFMFAFVFVKKRIIKFYLLPIPCCDKWNRSARSSRFCLYRKMQALPHFNCTRVCQSSTRFTAVIARRTSIYIYGT